MRRRYRFRETHFFYPIMYSPLSYQIRKNITITSDLLQLVCSHFVRYYQFLAKELPYILPLYRRKQHSYHTKIFYADFFSQCNVTSLSLGVSVSVCKHEFFCVIIFCWVAKFLVRNEQYRFKYLQPFDKIQIFAIERAHVPLSLSSPSFARMNLLAF